jgi:hypothetical protein
LGFNRIGSSRFQRLNILLPQGARLIKARSYIRATVTAGMAHEQRLDIGQPDVIRLLVPADRDTMAALVIRAIDQDTARTTGAHFAEHDLGLAGFGHGTMIAPIGLPVKPQDVGGLAGFGAL